MRIALIAHDKKKADMVEFCKEHESILSKYDLVGTGTTSTRVMESTNLKIECMKSGPLGGDQEIGAQVANGKIDLIITNAQASCGCTVPTWPKEPIKPGEPIEP